MPIILEPTNEVPLALIIRVCKMYTRRSRVQSFSTILNLSSLRVPIINNWTLHDPAKLATRILTAVGCAMLPQKVDFAKRADFVDPVRIGSLAFDKKQRRPQQPVGHAGPGGRAQRDAAQVAGGRQPGRQRGADRARPLSGRDEAAPRQPAAHRERRLPGPTLSLHRSRETQALVRYIQGIHSCGLLVA